MDHLEQVIEAEAIRARSAPVTPAVWFANHWRRMNDLRAAAGTYVGPIPAQSLKHASPVMPEANQGRWLVNCPDGCGGAGSVTTALPLYICLYCGSAGKWYDVTFPGDKDAIDTELMLRLHPANRNWQNGDTLVELRQERIANQGE